jgi:hypothetical protein
MLYIQSSTETYRFVSYIFTHFSPTSVSLLPGTYLEGPTDVKEGSPVEGRRVD